MPIKPTLAHVGDQSTVHVPMLSNLGVALARLSEAVVCSRALLTWCVCVCVQLPMVTFDLCHASPTLTQAHPNPSPSVELEDPGPISGSVQLEDV